MIKAIIISILSVTLLSGCGLFPTKYRDVPVPVYQVPAPPKIDRPSLPIHSLTIADTMDVQKVIKAHVVSTRLLINYSEALSEIVNTYAELAARTENLLIEPVFEMAFSSDRDSSVEITELERLRMVAQARSIRQDAEISFATILEKYQQGEQEILEEFNNETPDD